MVVLRPRLGVKRSEKGRAHVCIFPRIFFEALSKSLGFRPSDMLYVRAPRSSIRRHQALAPILMLFLIKL